jgi:hypothetical protein
MASTCNCITEVQKRFIDAQPLEGLHIKQARLKEIIFSYKTSSSRTVTPVELTCEERKRPIIHKIVHAYCPFCGKKHEEESKEVSHG